MFLPLKNYFPVKFMLGVPYVSSLWKTIPCEIYAWCPVCFFPWKTIPCEIYAWCPICFFPWKTIPVKFMLGVPYFFPRESVGYVQWRRAASSLVNRQRRSRVGRWLAQSSHSVAEQSATATTRPHWQHTLSSQAVAAMAIILQWTDVTTVRRTQQWGVCVWRHLSIQSTLRLSDWLITALVRLTTLIYRVAQKSKPCMVSQKVVPKCANKASCGLIWVFTQAHNILNYY